MRPGDRTVNPRGGVSDVACLVGFRIEGADGGIGRVSAPDRAIDFRDEAAKCCELEIEP